MLQTRAASGITGVSLLAHLESKSDPVQRRVEKSNKTASVHQAAEGLQGSPQRLPHLSKIQESFGEHSVGEVKAHVGGPAREASEKMGALAYASGDSIAFKESPDLHTAAHEAAHIVQQRRGVSLPGGVGRAGDAYEQHADAVADAVVQGKSAEQLLGSVPEGGLAKSGLQKKDEEPNTDKDGDHDFREALPGLCAAWLGLLEDAIVEIPELSTELEAVAQGALTLMSTDLQSISGQTGAWVDGENVLMNERFADFLAESMPVKIPVGAALGAVGLSNLVGNWEPLTKSIVSLVIIGAGFAWREFQGHQQAKREAAISALHKVNIGRGQKRTDLTAESIAKTMGTFHNGAAATLDLSFVAGVLEGMRVAMVNEKSDLKLLEEEASTTSIKRADLELEQASDVVDAYKAVSTLAKLEAEAVPGLTEAVRTVGYDNHAKAIESYAAWLANNKDITLTGKLFSSTESGGNDLQVQAEDVESLGEASGAEVTARTRQHIIHNLGQVMGLGCSILFRAASTVIRPADVPVGGADAKKQSLQVTGTASFKLEQGSIQWASSSTSKDRIDLKRVEAALLGQPDPGSAQAEPVAEPTHEPGVEPDMPEP